MMEPMSWPRRHSDFPEWLVPARNNIQRALLRIKELLAAFPQTTDADQTSLDEDLLNLMLGAAFSLWRTVFQAGHQYDQRTAVSGAREFVDEVVRDTAAIHAMELSAWLLGYYLSDARLRLVEVVKLWGPRHLDSEFFHGFRSIEVGPFQRTFTPKRWGQCFAVLHDLLLSYEGRAERTRTGVPTDSKPKGPPTVVGDRETFAYAILQSDWSQASFAGGKWQPGILFDPRDYHDMYKIVDAEHRSALLDTASKALEKSRERTR